MSLSPYRGYCILHHKNKRFREESDLVTVCSSLCPSTTSRLPTSPTKDILFHVCWYFNSNKVSLLPCWDPDMLKNLACLRGVHLFRLYGYRFVPLVASAIHNPWSPVASKSQASSMVSLLHSLDQLPDYCGSFCIQLLAVARRSKFFFILFSSTLIRSVPSCLISVSNVFSPFVQLGSLCERPAHDMVLHFNTHTV